MKRKELTTGLTITNSEDGVWLNFETSNKGKYASINLALYGRNDGNIIAQTIRQWAKEFAEAGSQT